MPAQYRATTWSHCHNLVPPGAGFYEERSFVAEIILSAPVTNAWPEQVATALRRIKTRLRSKLGNDMMFSLMHITINGPELDTSESREMVKQACEDWKDKAIWLRVNSQHTSIFHSSWTITRPPICRKKPTISPPLPPKYRPLEVVLWKTLSPGFTFWNFMVFSCKAAIQRQICNLGLFYCTKLFTTAWLQINGTCAVTIQMFNFSLYSDIGLES